jgi:peptidoglycan-associated lipoprotein
MNSRRMLLAMSAIMVLTLVGCSTKGASSTSSGVESGKAAGSKADRSGSGAPGTQGSGDPSSGGQPLTGFSKKPGDETVAGSGPLTLSKADPQSQEALENQRRLRGDKRQALADVYFPFDRWGLSEDGKKNLVQSAEYLREHPAAKLLIEGHCDERGSREYNLALGQKRANETRSFLTDLGIRNPIAITSYGKERPVCEERDESCYSKNRRAHLLIQSEP